MAYIQFYYPKRLAFSPVDFEYPGLGISARLKNGLSIEGVCRAPLV